MKTYLSHISAAVAWDVPYLHTVLGYSSPEQLCKACTNKLQRCALRGDERIRTNRIEGHYKVLELPRGSTIALKGDLIASPELVFLELANELSFHRLALLGMQLCSSDANGRIPLTNVKKLRRYISKCEGHHGYRLANKVVKYLADNSWSIMESLLYLLLSLPYKYGGYGLKGVELNQKITERSRKNGKVVKHHFADLYWEQAKLVVEYDSFAFHNKKEMWIKDAQRLVALERTGFNVFSINTTQLYSAVALEDAAMVIAKYLNKRIQIRSDRFVEQNKELRALLPRRTNEVV